MTPVAYSLGAAVGTYFLYTSVVFGWGGWGFGPCPETRARRRRSMADWLIQAGVEDVRPVEFVSVVSAVFIVSSTAIALILGVLLPAAAAGACIAAAPIALYRARRNRLRELARESWPRMIEEIRLLTGSLGRSIPIALLEVGRRAPTGPMRAAFEAAQREWQLSTDFARTTRVLKARLADPTADAACETLLVAHDVGGGDLDRRLEALLADRRSDLQARKDARSRQAGVRFARWFVLAVPVGMALVGLSIGDGRAAYRTGGAQVAALVAIALVAGCWVWAGRIMRLPDDERVLDA